MTSTIREGATFVEEELRGGAEHLPPLDAQVDGGLHGVRDAEGDQAEAQLQPTICQASLGI